MVMLWFVGVRDVELHIFSFSEFLVLSSDLVVFLSRNFCVGRLCALTQPQVAFYSRARV